MPTQPIEPPGTGLLKGRNAVITAAAGSGIGGSLGPRDARGRNLVISDADKHA